MAYPLVQFVIEPDATPDVVLDVNTTSGMYVVDATEETFSLGAPDGEFEPETVNADEGYRTVEFTVAVMESYTVAALHMSNLSKVLGQPSGWLMVQRSATSKPVFMRWYRTGAQAVSWERALNDTYTLPVVLTCDPDLYAEPHVLGTFEVVNNPAAASGNKASIVLPAIRGDAPAPLKVDIVPDSTDGPDWAGFQPFMASIAYLAGTSWDGPIVWDLLAAQWTAGTGTAGNVVDSSLYVGGSYRSTDFVGGPTDAMLARLTGSPVAAPKPGRYKVMLRCALTADESVIQVRLGQKFNVTQTRYGPTKTIHREPNLTSGAIYACWVDLGEQTFPFGAGGLDYTDAGAATIPEIVLEAARLEGAADLRWDALLLIPIETVATAQPSRTQTSRFHGYSIESDRSGVWDGFKQRFAAYNFGTSLANLRQPDIRGGWLEVVPGASNIFTLLQQSLIDEPFFVDLPRGDVVANTSHVTLSYLPKYRYLRPDTG